MKKILPFLCILVLIAGILVSCEQESPNAYQDYMSVDLTPINDNSEELNYQVQITNFRNQEFNAECKLVFTLIDEVKEKRYVAYKDVVNTEIEKGEVDGYFTLSSGGQFTIISDINKLNWIEYRKKEIEAGDYSLQVALIINEEPVLQDNELYSNKIIFRKK